MEIHKLVKIGPKFKTIPFFERRDHGESKYAIKNKLRLFQNTPKGCKTKN